ncbi:MAG: DUF951 domain-containing protein [Armatimonadetes bacterium]|nr:DUF951 domain-containing protein [Armatimonadota bacterium]
MRTDDDLHMGDIVQLKKSHACGSNQWEVIRLGADIRARCCQCGRVVMIPRRRFARLTRARQPRAQASEEDR